MPKLHLQAADVDARLTELKLERTHLVRAVLAGDAGASASTALHPPTDAGSRRWGDTVAGLRRELLPRGWEMSNALNYCTAFNREARISVAVMVGDLMTGSVHGSPKSRYPKGSVTRTRILQNITQVSMFPDLRSPDEVAENECDLWVLVQHETSLGIQVEFSRPVAMSGSGKTAKVVSWDERLLFPTIDPRGFRSDAGEASPPSEPGVDFAVKAR